MAENQTDKREATVNWEFLNNDEEFGEKTETQTIVIEEEKPTDTQAQTTEVEKKTDVVEEKKDETKTETTTEIKADDKKEGDNKEEKTETTGDKEVPEVLELKIEDVKGYDKPAEDGSWFAVAQGFGVKAKEDTFESVKEALEGHYKAQIEEAKKYSLENEYSKLKPETVTALKLIEMGVPQEEAFNPTAEHDKLLKMDNTALIRSVLEATPGWDAERVDLEMESLSADERRLKHEALKIRENIEYNKKAIGEQREALLNEYTQNKEKAVVEQRNQELSQIKESLGKVDEFMGAKINPEARAAILEKHSRGDYGNVLKDAKSIADYIYFKEFGSTILDNAKKSSYAKGKEEYAKQMLNVPPKQGEVAKKVSAEKINQGLKNNFEILNGEF